MNGPNINVVSTLPVWVRIADALVTVLVALATWVALVGGLSFSLFGLRISANNITRLLIEAVVVFALRHVLVRHRPLHERIRIGLGAWVTGGRVLVTRLARPAVLAFGLPALVYLAILVHRYDGGPYMRGDCSDYYRTARSILEDGDLDISNQFAPPYQTTWEGVALAVDGRLVPKHPIPMPVASIPFVAALGPPGALVFNLVQLGCLLAVLYRLAARWASAWAAAASVALTGISTFLPHYVWNYSPDVFAALVLAAALLPLTPGGSSGSSTNAWRFLLAGVLAGLAVIAKQPLIVFVPTMFAFVRRPYRRSAAALAAGLLISLGAFGLHNARLFGSPLTTAYDRIAVREGARIGTFSQRSSFTLPMARGARGQILDPTHGLLATSAVTLVSLAGLPALAARSRAVAAHVGVGSLALFLLLSMYDQWNASHYGNRFLMPIVCLCAIPLAVLLESVHNRLRRRWPGRFPDGSVTGSPAVGGSGV